MAVYLPSQGIYTAAKTWTEKCLVGDGSLFSAEALWTLENLEELDRCYVRRPDLSKQDFMTKLERQLSVASAPAKRLAAEFVWPILLFASNVNPATKILKIRRIWSWTGSELAVDCPMLESTLLEGIGSMGPAIQNLFWMEYAYSISTVRELKALAPKERSALLADAWALAAFLDARDPSHGRQFYHALLHLLFPELFERIASRSHKKWIFERFGEGDKPYDVKDRVSTDRQLLAIRSRLESQYGKGFDYYETPEIRPQWLPPRGDGSDDGDGEEAQSAYAAAGIPERYRGARIWAIGAGSEAHLWEDFKSRSAIAIGYEDFGAELATLSKEEIFSQLEASRGGGAKPTMDALAAYQFASEMKEGDFVLAKQGRTLVLGLGRIQSGCRYDPAFPEYHHVRNVEWLKTGEWRLSETQRITTKTLTDMSRYKTWLAYVFNLLGETGPLEEGRDSGGKGYSAKTSERPYAIDDLIAEGAFLDVAEIQGALDSLDNRMNLILSGPPGTGKSWLALRLAWIKLGCSGDDPRLMAVQFHQSYSYEEFVRGWRPGKGGFELRDGPFLEFCEAARKDEGRPYILFIDEINRGDPSRIFGEMLSLLEKDKRRPECALKLSIQKPGEPPFYIPPNLYLIGTMNSADRSLAVVDYALRRRFAFVQLEPAFGKDGFSNYMGDDLGVGMDQELLKRIVESMSRS